MTVPPPRWDVRDLTKCYGALVANDRVSIALHPGRIHGLLGANGSGKSTLIRILSGVERPDGGTVSKGGVAHHFASPSAARAAGIATVFQEFSLAPDLSVAENIFLGRLPTVPGGGVDWRAVDAGAAATLRLLQIDRDIDPPERVGDLSVAQQQLVEIAKAVAIGADTLILDEPTAALGTDEIARLHSLLRRLARDGHAILYVSHRLDELVSLVDVATVLRNGRVVADAVPVTLDAIVTAMIGAQTEDFYPPREALAGEPVLTLNRIATAAKVKDVSLTLHAGEILGVAGVLGSGRTELLHALFGLNPLLSGDIKLRGAAFRPRSPGDAIAQGLGMVPENRKSDALFPDMATAANATISALDRIGDGPFVDESREQSVLAQLSEQLELVAHAGATPIMGLSGGNQQKVVIGRWIACGSNILLLDEPTQGIDVGARAAIYRLLRDLARRGTAILLVSADTEELVRLSDRIVILRDGQSATTLDAASIDEIALSHLIAGRADKDIAA